MAIALSIAFLLPFVFILATALMTNQQALTATTWPDPFRWSNFAEVFRAFPFVRYTLNTVTYAVLATVGVVAGNRTLLDWAASTSEPSGVFWIGTASLVAAGLLLATGTRRYFSVQKVLFALAVIGTVVLVAVMLLGLVVRDGATAYDVTP